MRLLLPGELLTTVELFTPGGLFNAVGLLTAGGLFKLMGSFRLLALFPTMLLVGLKVFFAVGDFDLFFHFCGLFQSCRIDERFSIRIQFTVYP